MTGVDGFVEYVVGGISTRGDVGTGGKDKGSGCHAQVVTRTRNGDRRCEIQVTRNDSLSIRSGDEMRSEMLLKKNVGRTLAVKCDPPPGD